MDRYFAVLFADERQQGVAPQQPNGERVLVEYLFEGYDADKGQLEDIINTADADNVCAVETVDGRISGRLLILNDIVIWAIEMGYLEGDGDPEGARAGDLEGCREVLATEKAAAEAYAAHFL